MHCICESKNEGVNRWKNCTVQNWWKGKISLYFQFQLFAPLPPPLPPHTPFSQLALKPPSANCTYCTSEIFFKPLGVVHVPVAQKPSDQVTLRTRLNRTKALETVGNKISSDRFEVHMIHTLKRKSQEERWQILHDALGKELVLNIPEGQANAMKADLGITWYRLKKLRRYIFKQFYCPT